MNTNYGNIEGDEIIIPITESQVQSFAEDNLGRPLTDIELNRMKQYFFQNDEYVYNLSVMLDSIIQDVTTDKTVNWTKTDAKMTAPTTNA